MEDQSQPERSRTAEAERRGSAGSQGGVLSFLRDTRKWWMTPIVVALLMVGVLLVLSGSAAGPLIYALF